jgi:hypothetical protein
VFGVLKINHPVVFFVQTRPLSLSSWICCGVSNYLAVALAKFFGSFGSTIISYMALDSATLWRVVVATVFGVVFSFTPMKNIEGAGASKVRTRVGSVAPR